MSSAKQSGAELLPDHSMTEVPKEFFFDGMQLPASVYIKMKAGNYLLIGKKNDKANFSNLHSFQNDNAKFYVKNLEHPELISIVTQLTSKVISQKNVPDAVKMKFVAGLAADAVDSLSSTGVVSVSKAQRVAALIDQMSKSVPSFHDVLDIIMSYPNTDAKHAMTTCLLSMLLCDEMQINLPLAREKVALGALLHDVGLKFIPKSIIDRPRHLWSQQDLETFESHPIKGVEMLRDVKDIPSDVLLIVAEHHENAHGTGFPKRLRDIKISPLGRIVSLANAFADLLFSQKTEAKIYSADEAVHYIEEILGQPYNKQVFNGLKNIINKKALKDKVED